MRTLQLNDINLKS